MKNFAMIVELEERQVVVMKAFRNEEQDDEAPWLINVRFLLVSGDQSDINLGFSTEEHRDEAFTKLQNNPEMTRQQCRTWVDSVAKYEQILLETDEDENDD